MIVSHNTRDLVLDCVRSASVASPASITVVDNASADGTVDALAGLGADITVIANTENNGYGAAVNQAMATGRAEFVLVLNGDTVVQPDSSVALAAHLHAHPRTALLGPIIRRTDGSIQKSTYPFPSLLDTLVGETGLQLALARIPAIRERFLRTWSHDRARAVDWVVGAAFVIRRATFDQIGGFDEGYFMYSEEVDLCRRLVDAGHVVEFAPVTEVVHVGEASAAQDRSRMDRERQRSAVRYLRTHETPRRARRLLAALRLITALRCGRDHLLAMTSRGDDARRRRSEATAKAALVREHALWRI